MNQPRASRIVLVVVAASAALLIRASPAQAASYVVDTTDDDPGVAKTACNGAADDCSLRGAITNANAASTPGDVITFDAAVFNPGTISIASVLPSLSDGGDTLDGTGATVIIDGVDRGFDCVVLESAGNIIKGLQLTDCASGIRILGAGDNSTIGPGNVMFDNSSGVSPSFGADGNMIIGNKIGTNAAGTEIPAEGGNLVGVNLIGSANNTVGSANPADRNIISGNSNGITVSAQATGNTIIGNFIGTDAAGTVDLGNGNGVGISAGGADNTVGGASPGERNIISGNTNGIAISGSTGNTVIGNYIGTDVNGTAALGNTNGVLVSGSASGNTVGGNTPGEANLISDNSLSGVSLLTSASDNSVVGNIIGPDVNGSGTVMENTYGVRLLAAASNNTIGPRNVISDINVAAVQIFGAGTTGNVVRENFIGTDSAGSASVPNAGQGVLIENSASGNIIGGTDPGDGNVIAFNGDTGVQVDGADDPSAVSNSIRGNSMHSNVGLEIDNVNGGNTELPPPNIANTLFGTVSGFACANCEVDVFSDNSTDARFFEGSVTAAGDGSFTFVSGAPFVGASVTATNTDAAGNTSELATTVAVDSDGDGSDDGTDTDDDNDGILDASDPCRVFPEDFDGFQDADGCPDPDNDEDGICDPGMASVSCTGSDEGKMVFDPAGTLPAPTIDCRNVPEDFDAFKDSDGCPEPDNDNDGFPDATDDCPGTDAHAGGDGMLGSPEDLNHNGVSDGGEDPLTTDDSVLVFEDYDGVLDTDGCHDSPGDDFDGDGFTDDDEVFVWGTEPFDPDTDNDGFLDGADNCPAWQNPGQLLPIWPIPLGDGDCDGFSTADETYFGTDPRDQCPDDPADDAWGPDFDKNAIVDINDALSFRPVILEPSDASPEALRHDLIPSEFVDITDVLVLRLFILESCTNP